MASREQRIQACKDRISEIRQMLQSQPNTWLSYIGTARSVVATVDATSFMADRGRVEEQTWILEGLQNLAFYGANSNQVLDIGHWCMRQWPVVLQHDPQNVGTLTGMVPFAYLGP